MAYGDKRCKVCKVPFTEENRYSERSYMCKTCEKQYKKDRYQSRQQELAEVQSNRRRADPDKYYATAKASRIRTKYGLEPEDVERMMKEQDGKCAICQAVLDATCIDHCHDTGMIRGLLCTYCNKGLGFFRDNVQSLAAAIVYLEKFK
jgi:hypothetical protein